MSTPLEQLVGYFEIRAKQRAEARERLAVGFTERELRLIREAAVMGYVQGVQSGPHRDRIPPDSQILIEVLDACLVHSDLYPTITGDAS